MALNKAVFEGTLRRIPTIRELNNGARRCDFTVRVPRGNGNFDFIDCCAYNQVADSLQHADISQWVRVRGAIRTWRTETGLKKHSVNIDKWEQIPPVKPSEQDA